MTALDDDELLALARLDAEGRARREVPAPNPARRGATVGALEATRFATTCGPRVPRPDWCANPACRAPGCSRYDARSGRVVRFALCPKCTDADRRARWGDRIARARASLPVGARGADLEAKWLEAMAGPFNLDEARAWALAPLDLTDRLTWMLAIEGGADTAKSALAFAVAWAVLDQGERDGASEADAQRAAGVRYVRALDLAASGPQHGLGKGPSPLEAEARAATLLVLDDVGAEDADPGKVVARVLHARYDERRQTVATTGLGRDAFRLRYDDGVHHKTFGGSVITLRAR